MARQSDFITESRQHARALWNAINGLKSMQREWNALDLGNTLDPGEGANAGIVAADVGSVVFDTTAALEAVLNAGHATNLAKLL
jgi:hypothetical protein